MSVEKMMRYVGEPVGGWGEESEMEPLIKGNRKLQGIGRRKESSACLAKRAHPLRDGGELCATRFKTRLSCEKHDANLANRGLQVAQLRFIQIKLAVKLWLHPQKLGRLRHNCTHFFARPPALPHASHSTLPS